MVLHLPDRLLSSRAYFRLSSFYKNVKFKLPFTKSVEINTLKNVH